MSSPLNIDEKLSEILAYNPFDFVEGCEPDCTPERHAYHQGQWDMACRINKHYGVLPNPVDGDEITEQARTLFIELVRELLPEKKRVELQGVKAAGWIDTGYNQAIDEILTRLDKLGVGHADN